MIERLGSVGCTLLRRAFEGCLGLVERGSGLSGGVGAGAASGLDSKDRARVIDTLEGDLDCLVDDAANRGITERSAEELLLTVAVLDWLRGGGLPGKGAVDFMEQHVAVMNAARHVDEVELREALRAVLEELAAAQQEAIAAGRWSEREPDAEAALGRRLRQFGRNLDELRKRRGLTIGEVADRAEIDVVNIVAFLVGAEEPGADALWMLAGALSTDPGKLFPPEPGALPHGPLDTVIGEVPAPDPDEDGADPADEGTDR